MFLHLYLALFALACKIGFWLLPALVTKENDYHMQVPLIGWN